VNVVLEVTARVLVWHWLQPPFYSRNRTEMYDKTLKKPLEFRTKGNNSEAAIDILQKVICQVPY